MGTFQAGKPNIRQVGTLIHIITGAVTNFSPGTGEWEENYVFQGGEEANGIDAYHEQPS